eukprot:SAG11_NODE_6032_length_1405_cov_2.457121_2_plen_67_part_00
MPIKDAVGMTTMINFVPVPMLNVVPVPVPMSVPVLVPFATVTFTVIFLLMSFNWVDMMPSCHSGPL